jgi:branched-subunit amino acid ABC-type transport system permease component
MAPASSRATPGPTSCRTSPRTARRPTGSPRSAATSTPLDQQNVWYGLSLGSVLLLAAIGLAITFGVMGVINMAHGEMVMLGAYTTFVVQEVIRSLRARPVRLVAGIALPLAFLVAGLVGIADRARRHPLPLRPAAGNAARDLGHQSLILQQAVRTIFGRPTARWRALLDVRRFELGGLTITWNRLWIVVFALVVFFALLFVLKRTPLGLQMRAVTQNRRMAPRWASARPRRRADLRLGSGIAGIAGVALSQIDNVSPNLGQATSSTASWSWCSAASAISGARWSARSRSASPTSSSNPMPARCSARSWCWCSSSCSSRSGRAACSRSRAGRWSMITPRFFPALDRRRDLPAS